MSFDPMNGLQATHIDAIQNRNAAPKKESRPLFITTPLPSFREKKAAPLPKKKRKRAEPTTPAFSFDPKRSVVPSGKQDPVSSSVHSRPSTSESSASSQDEPQTTPFSDHETYDQLYNAHDAQKRPRIFPGCSSIEPSSSFYSDTPCTDISPPDFQDSPVSYTSSSSPAPSDQSPHAAEFGVQVVDYALQVQSMYPYGVQGYVQQPVAHPDPYSYSMDPCPDPLAQGHPGQHSDAPYGRPVPHGIPAYPDINGYPYPPRKY
ncbi:hypothetical protein OG21DRAFT_1495783 [Imleria badia]|nr:hypothetical protein OG21DRAFT_1495783 [Imleria badia]